MAEQNDAATVEVIVKFVVPQALSAEARESLTNCGQTLGIRLSPIDSDASATSDLATFYAARVSSNEATRIVTRLRECAGVEAAYVKPRGEPPNGRM